MNDMILKNNAIFNSILQFRIKMQSFFTCTKINDKDLKDQNAFYRTDCTLKDKGKVKKTN
jgi:hypothetical protein